MLDLNSSQAGVGTGESGVDRAIGAMLKTGRLPERAAAPKRAHGLVDHRKQFSLLVVRGDGSRVLRLAFPRRLPILVVVGVAIATAAVGVLAGDWWKVRGRLRDSASLFQQIDEQQAVIDSFNHRIALLRKEVDGWGKMHERIWEPFGPDRGPRSRDKGIGGVATTPPDRPAPGGTALDELDRLSETVMAEGQSLRALDRLIGRAAKAIASLPSRWPVRGAINSKFGNRLSPWTKRPEFHSGLDIAASMRTVVRAPAAGTVAFAGMHGDYGMTVILDHGAELKTIYGHLSKLKVRAGQHVSRGTALALTGNTGRSSGPHLHYEIVVRGRSVDPRAYFWD